MAGRHHWSMSEALLFILFVAACVGFVFFFSAAAILNKFKRSEQP
jgi:hypothetical protein